jgi:hypothetical protein
VVVGHAHDMPGNGGFWTDGNNLLGLLRTPFRLVTVRAISVDLA